VSRQRSARAVGLARLLRVRDGAAARVPLRRLWREPSAPRRRCAALQGEVALADRSGRRAEQVASDRASAGVAGDARLPEPQRVHRAARRPLRRPSALRGRASRLGGARAARVARRARRRRRGHARARERARHIVRRSDTRDRGAKRALAPAALSRGARARTRPARNRAERRAGRGVRRTEVTAVLRLLRNVSSNYLYAVVNGLVLVVLTPIVVRTLGVEMYAVWVIVQTLAYYLGFLDLGVVDAQVQRHAVLASQKRFDEIGRLHGTVLCFFLAAGMVGLLIAIAVAALPSAQLFDVPAAAREAYGTALVLASGAMLLSFAGSAFNGIYEGFQRYDLMNAVNIVVSIVEAVSIYAVLAAGAGIVALAIVKIGAEALRAVLKLATAWRVFPSYALPRLRF